MCIESIFQFNWTLFQRYLAAKININGLYFEVSYVCFIKRRKRLNYERMCLTAHTCFWMKYVKIEQNEKRKKLLTFQRNSSPYSYFRYAKMHFKHLCLRFQFYQSENQMSSSSRDIYNLLGNSPRIFSFSNVQAARIENNIDSFARHTNCIEIVFVSRTYNE